MTFLYSYEFEIENEVCKVTFFDDTYNITNAESLGQISHVHRRKWALEIVEYFLTTTETHGTWNSIFIEDTPFTKRLIEEGWKDCPIRFVRTLTQFSLHIYRFFII